jgi:DNA-binding CsgD family transcriptional regulator
MQLPTWDALAIELLKHGYRPVQYVETFCPSCGDWRGSVDPVGEAIACPKCSKPPVSHAVLGRGFTRRETIPWFRVSLPVPKAWKTDSDRDDVPSTGPRLPVFKPPAGKSADQSAEGVEASDTISKAEKEASLRPRDVEILKLLAADLPPDSVAVKLNPPTSGRAIIQTMFRLRKRLGCQTTAGACCKALRQGLIS